MRYITGIVALTVFAVGSMGCDEESACEYAGERIAVGASVDDPARRLRCVCTANGLDCGDLADAVVLGDAAPADAALDEAPPDRPGPDAAPDAEPDDAAAPVDAEPDAEPDADPMAGCPEIRLIGRSGCPGRSGLVCDQGPAFDCCGRPYPAEQRCTCIDDVWSCEDYIAACEADPEIGECGRRTRMCDRWTAVRHAEDPVDDWAGSHDLCVEDDMTPTWRETTLEMVNVLRSLAGVPEVAAVPSLDRFAQQCAPAIFWHRTFDHELEEHDQCYTLAAARGVQGSLIANVPAISSVEDYMRDFGEQNFDRMSHRLYLLSPQLGPIGIGSTSHASCIYVFGGDGPLGRPQWVAWPAPGIFPIDAAFTEPAGWTIQSNVINLAFADVTVTSDGEELPIDVRSLQAAGPAGWGLAWLPVGWQIEAGRSYAVRVEGGIRQGEDVPIDYVVDVIDCDAPAPAP